MTYVSTVLADNPQHYWRCSERAGQLIHDIGSSPFHCNGAWVQPGYSGISNDGGASYMSSNTGIWTGASLTITIPFTVEFWYWETYDNAATQRLFAHDGTAGSSFAVNSLSGRTLQFAAGAASFTSGAQAAQAWHHVVMAVGGLQGFAYIDGVSNTMAGAPGAASVTRSINWGALVASSTQGLNGAMCELAVYNFQLTPARVAAHFAAQEVSTAPQYLNIGAVGLGPSFTPDYAQLASILAAVQKTFPTT